MISGAVCRTTRGALAAAVAMGSLIALPAAAASTAVASANEGSSMPTADTRERITIVGTRISEGNAVDCPQLRTDDGRIYSVSYLAPSIAIGTRVSATGFFAHITQCRGEVLYLEDVALAGDR